MTIGEAVVLAEKEVISFTKSLSANNLYTPIGYIMGIGGKRLRPALAIMANQYFNGTLADILQPALGVEVFHNFSLLHDDIMDDAPLRRGQQTVHEKWNANSAILSGDAMLVQAYQLLAKSNSQYLAALLDLFGKTALEVCEGQQLDMDFETRDDVSISEYVEMIRLKTSVLLACSLQLGAISAGVSDEQAALIYQYGIDMGIAFQLRDDLLDAFGESSLVGKQIGGDILANKKTYLALKAKEKASAVQLDLLSALSTEQNKQKKVDETLSIFKDLEVDKAAEELAESHYLKALNSLNKTQGNEEVKNELLRFSASLMDREF